MQNLLLTILCSSGIAIILKINSEKNGDSLLLITGNYLIASILSFILFLSDNSSSTSLQLIPFGFFLSLLFVGSFFAFSVSVNLSGAAISTVSSRISVVLPTLLSIIIYSEFPTTIQALGLLLTVVTIVLFYFSVNNKNHKEKNIKGFTYLLFILIGIGFADFFMKVFQVNWSNNYKQWFLFWIFFSSFLLTTIFSIIRKLKFSTSTFLLGMMMGVPNFFSSYFLIESLRIYPAVFVYPFVNISIILVTAFVVKLFWKEHWNIYTIAAIALGALSALLLNM